MYRHMGLLDGILVVRSSGPEIRLTACDISDFLWMFRTKGRLFVPDSLTAH